MLNGSQSGAVFAQYRLDDVGTPRRFGPVWKEDGQRRKVDDKVVEALGLKGSSPIGRKRIDQQPDVMSSLSLPIHCTVQIENLLCLQFLHIGS